MSVFEGRENSYNRILELKRQGLSTADALHIERVIYPPKRQGLWSRFWRWLNAD